MNINVKVEKKIFFNFDSWKWKIITIIRFIVGHVYFIFMLEWNNIFVAVLASVES